MPGHRDRRSPEFLLCALCVLLGELCVKSRWLRRHRRSGLGGSVAALIFVSVSHFFTTERAERSAESAEPILLRPAVAVGRRRSPCGCVTRRAGGQAVRVAS